MSSHIFNLKRQPVDNRDLKLATFRAVSIPTKMDLRSKCPPVFDQGQLGSCTANAGVAARMMRDGISTTLSRLYLYYEERALEGTTGEDAGATMRSICKALHKSGVCPEAAWPYDAGKYADKPSDAATDAAGTYKIAVYKTFSNDGVDDVTQIKQYIATNNRPVLLGMEVYESMESDAVAKSGIVPMPGKNESLLGGHAVLAVGYDDEFNYGTTCIGSILGALVGSSTKGAFLVRNSWGADWGQEGYFWLPYAYVQKGLAYDFWVLE